MINSASYGRHSNEMKTSPSSTVLSGMINQLKAGLGSQEQTEAWLTPRSVSRELGVNLNSVYRWIATGELRAYDLSTGETGKAYYRVRRRDLEDWLSDRASDSVSR
jgi:excisionase family DNA binding protein